MKLINQIQFLSANVSKYPAEANVKCKF